MERGFTQEAQGTEAEPGKPDRVATKNGMRRLAGTVALGVMAAATAAGLFLHAPAYIANETVGKIRSEKMEPILGRVIAGLPGGSQGMFDVPPDAVLLAKLVERTEALNHRGLAIFDVTGEPLWHSDEFEVQGLEATVIDAMAVGEMQMIHVESALHEEEAGHAHEAGHGTSHLSTIIYPVLRDGRAVGALLIRFEDSALEAVVTDLTTILLGLFVGGAALCFGGAMTVSSRSQQARARAERQFLEASNSSMAEQLRLGREMSLLAELNEWLQSSRDLDELFSMVVKFLDVLLPGSSGSIYIYSNSRDVLDGAVSWGGARHHAHIHPQDSWALRRGRSYEFGETAVAFACGYVEDAALKPYLSIPFLAHGETVGLLHINYPDGIAEAERARLRRMAQTCAEQISLAIANVRMRDELRSQAVRDPLTGLFNRRYMMDRLRSLTERRGGEGFAFVSIDIDRFKTFNDNHGHEAGDAVIKAVGEAMMATLGPRAFACRTGGEELAIVIPESDLACGMDLAEALRATVETTQVMHNGTALPTVTISTGVAAYPRHGKTVGEIIPRADAALYTAKHRGRNCVVSADDAETGILSGVARPSEKSGVAASEPEGIFAIAAE